MITVSQYLTQLIDRFVVQNLVQITHGRILEEATEALFCISIMALVGCVRCQIKGKESQGYNIG